MTEPAVEVRVFSPLPSPPEEPSDPAPPSPVPVASPVAPAPGTITIEAPPDNKV